VPANAAKPGELREGTQRAPGVDMRDVDRIEAINREQLATATDRLLLRGRVARQRPARGSQSRSAVAAPAVADPRDAVAAPLYPAPRAQGSQPRIELRTPPLGAPLQAPRAQGSQPRIDVKAPRASASLPRIIVAPSLAHPQPPRRPLLPLQLFARR
jgi:hypothetical protein